jgi:hypothetical protein
VDDIILNVQEWPKTSDGVGYLCLIRNLKDGREHGFMIEGSWDINIGYIWDGGTGDYIPYKTPEEALSAGWVVD